MLTRSGTTWTHQATLTGSGETGEGEFGFSVAIASKEGNYALIGGPANNGGVGAAWTFLRETGKTTWTQQAKLTGGGESGSASFGDSVALSATGEYALTGGSKDNAEVGAAWVFLRSGTTWTQQGEKLTGKEEIHEGESSGKGAFGFSVALSANGEYALIGGPSDNGKIGAAWVFLRSGTTWAQQGPKLTGKEETGAGEFGYSVALSEKGEYALIGGPGDNEYAGAAWVFTRSGTTWTQQGAKLTGKEETRQRLLRLERGARLQGTQRSRLRADRRPRKQRRPRRGVGVPRDSGTTWNYQAKLTGERRDRRREFGTSVALSATGEYALIGGPSNKEGLGAAWVLTALGHRPGAYQATLTGNEESGEGEFGGSVALGEKAEKAEYALIGGPGNNGRVGAAWVLPRSGTDLDPSGDAHRQRRERQRRIRLQRRDRLQRRQLRADRRPRQQRRHRRGVGAHALGHDLDLSGDADRRRRERRRRPSARAWRSPPRANTRSTGGSRDNTEVGAAWVFLRDRDTTWTQQGEKLTGKEEAGEGEVKPGKGAFGFSVALSSEGNTALIGGHRYLNGVGAAWVFTRSGSTWTQQAKLTAKSGEEIGAGEFGSSVALSSNGNTALIGGYRDAEGDRRGVGVHALGLDLDPAGRQSSPAAARPAQGEFGASVALSSERQHRADRRPPDDTGVGAAWVFTRAGEKWTQQGEKLTGGGETGAGEFGTSVALSSEGNTALIGGPTDNAGVGAAWAFTRAGEKWTQQGEKLTGAGETGAGEFGDERGALLGRQHRADRRPHRQHRRRRGVGAHARGRELDPAGRKAHRRRRDRRGRIRHERGALLQRQHRADRRPERQHRRRRGVGVHALGRRWEQQGEKLTAKSGEEIGEGAFGVERRALLRRKHRA